jgi:hypothetical protein
VGPQVGAVARTRVAYGVAADAGATLDRLDSPPRGPPTRGGQGGLDFEGGLDVAGGRRR